MYSSEHFNPSKYNFHDASKEDFLNLRSVNEILTDLCICGGIYYSAPEISEDNEFQIHLWRPPNSCFVNNYFRPT